MSGSILHKYAEARLPRYTSYPTAPHFSDAVGSDIYGDWLAALPASEPVSLYLHIPFCRSMCWYCGCHTTVTRQDQPILAYLDVLQEEIGLVADRVPAALDIGEVHFGGGTPTIVEPEEFAALMELLRQRFAFSEATSVAVEIDPRTLSADMAAALGGSGVRRASLGVQSLDRKVQIAINRIQSEEQTAEAVRMLRTAGVESINFDLIYGLPHQNVTSCVETAERVAAMRPDRLAVFGYAHVPSFKKHQRMIDEAELPDSTARADQATAIAAILVAAGYVQIGLDHFALPEDELARAWTEKTLRRNFQGYTTDNCRSLIGFGASAIGRLDDGYVQNEVALGLYARHVASGRLPTAKGYRLTAEDRLRAEIIERLMCYFEADIPAICATHGFDASAIFDCARTISDLVHDGLVELNRGIVRVDEKHRFIIRSVAAAFDAHLAQSSRLHSKAV